MSEHDNIDQNTLWELARQAFGDELAQEWLQRPSRLFDGLTPQEKASEASGAQAVIEFIQSLIQGSQTDLELNALS